MREHLREVIVTDIPEPAERAPLEFDPDISRRDMWLFAPVIAAAVTLPLIAAALFGLSVWHLATEGPSIASKQPTTFASRWPSREMPMIVVR
jgi:hypothetical protein